MHKIRISQNANVPLHPAECLPFPSVSAPQPAVEKTDVVVCGTTIDHLLKARQLGFLPPDPDWHFVYPERIMKNGTIPGISETPEVYCYISVEKANASGILFVLNSDAENDDFHLRMVSSGEDGIPFSAIRRVIDNRPGFFGAIRYVDAADPDMAFMHKSGIVHRKIWHATYWNRLARIQTDGLLPNQKNEFGLALGNHVHLGIGDPAKKVKGLVRRPDVLFEIDPTDLTDAISLIPDQLDTILVGSITPMALRSVKPIIPMGMPDDLQGQVVAFKEIPILDCDIPEDELIKAMRHALSVGFMQIVNHGIPQELCDRCLMMGRQFFSLPQDTKDRMRISPGNIRGYFGKGAENIDGLLDEDRLGGSTKMRMDCKEGLDLKGCQGDGGGAATEEGAAFSADASWLPDESVHGLRLALTEYQERALELSRKLLVLFAKALDLPDPDVFTRAIEKPVATHRLLHYWPLENFKDEISIGAHCDYGLLTILLQDGTGGLQVLNSEKEWVHCPPVDGAVVCNIGDMLAKWTNNRCQSTIHRVVNVSDVDRYSMPFFLEPSFSTLIDPTTLGLAPATQVHTCEEILIDYYVRGGLLKRR